MSVHFPQPIVALIALAALLVSACAPAAAPAPAQAPGKPATAAESQPATAPDAAKKSLKIGTAGNGKTFLPTYVLADRTAAEEGLEVEVVTLQGGAPLMQAIAGGSIDVGVTGLNSLITAINAGQPVKAFYTGLNLGDFQWFAKAGINSWADLRGKTLGVTGPGSLIDLLSRVVLEQHGLVPEQDVQFVTTGNPPTSLQALQAGKVDATVLTNPTAWQAEEGGFVRLGTLGSEIADVWPQSVLVASEKFIAEQPDTVRALLRAQVRAMRLIEQDRAAAADALVKHVKFAPAIADRTYDEVKGKMNERGLLPEPAMPAFWKITKLAGEADEPWAESRYFDRRFIDTFDQWAPK